MPFICTNTKEMALALDDAEVIVETSPKTLVSHTSTKGHSAVTGNQEKWVWKEEHELSAQERQQYAKLLMEKK